MTKDQSMNYVRALQFQITLNGANIEYNAKK